MVLSFVRGQSRKRSLVAVALGAGAGIVALMGGCASRTSDPARFVPSAWPTSHPDRVISSGFGSRRDPIEGDRRHHKGLDIAVPRKSKVRATAKGVVAFSGTSPTYGRYVIIDHGNGTDTLYAHLYKRKAKKGKKVKRGDVIGLAGQSGRATAPHLHYEIRKNGQPIDPRPHLSF